LRKKYFIKNKLLVKEEIFPLLSKVDTIIFDVDGVLVDVSASYYQTIIDTVQYYFNSIIGISPGKGKLIDEQVIDNFKTIGGFNDDWELSAAAVLFYLWKMKKYQLSTIDELKNNPPLINEFINENLVGGGGLSQLISWIKDNSTLDNIFSLWNKGKIFRIAKEFYSGEKYCFQLFKFYPEIVGKEKGNIEKEIVSIKPEIIKKLRKFHIGILTGRSRAEANILIEKNNWYSWLKEEMIITPEDNKRKPSPDGLRFFLKKFQSELGLYIGDTMDDLLTVKNLNQQYEKLHCLSALVLGEYSAEKEIQIDYYQKNDIDLLAENVNQLIELIFDYQI